MSGVVSLRLEKAERQYLREETRRRGNTYMSETIRELLGFPKSTVKAQPIPLLDQLDLESPVIASVMGELVDRIDDLRKIVMAHARHEGVPRNILDVPEIGATRLKVVGPGVEAPAHEPVALPEGFAR